MRRLCTTRIFIFQGLIPRLSVVSPTAVSDDSAYQMYCARVQSFFGPNPPTPSSGHRHPLQRSGRQDRTIKPSTLREVEYLSYFNLVSVQAYICPLSVLLVTSYLRFISSDWLL